MTWFLRILENVALGDFQNRYFGFTHYACQGDGRFESRSKTGTIRPIVVKIVPTVANEIVRVW